MLRHRAGMHALDETAYAQKIQQRRLACRF